MSQWAPSTGPDVAAGRSSLLRRIRAYFDAAGVLEVDTPALAPSAVSDIHIESLEVSSRLAPTPLYLNTSPEYCMKRLLAAGYPDIVSIARVFRDGESGARHQMEFTLIEWYRRDMRLDDIVDDTLAVIAAALERPELVRDATIVDYRDAFQRAVGIDPLSTTPDVLAEIAGAGKDLRDVLGNRIDDWLDLVLAAHVAPTFTADGLTVLRHYPASQAALARICPGDNAVADRFEVFYGELELANGYVELTDATVQANRFAADQAARNERGLPQRPIDSRLLDALDSGLPECAGVAMGLERLQMVGDEVDDIRSVIAFEFEAYHD